MRLGQKQFPTDDQFIRGIFLASRREDAAGSFQECRHLAPIVQLPVRGDGFDQRAQSQIGIGKIGGERNKRVGGLLELAPGVMGFADPIDVLISEVGSFGPGEVGGVV